MPQREIGRARYEQQFAQANQAPRPSQAAPAYEALKLIAAPCLAQAATDKDKLRLCLKDWHGKLFGLPPGDAHFDAYQPAHCTPGRRGSRRHGVQIAAWREPVADVLAQLLVGGLGTGCIYALVGLGFTLVYRTMRMVNFAQGQVFMAGTFLGLFGAQQFGLPALPLLLLVAVISFAVGMVLERVVFRRLYASHEVFVVGAIGLGVMIENGFRIFFPEPLPFPKSSAPACTTCMARCSRRPICGSWSSRWCWSSVCTCCSRTPAQGRALRAVAADGEIAGTMGVNVQRAIAVTFGLSCAIAAVAGVLIGPLYFVSPDMGDLVGLKAFSAAVLGGINSVIGTILGGLALGLMESMAAFYISSDYKDLLAFVILLLMLLVRPQGLLGRPVPVKV